MGEGGVGELNIRTELRALAAATVANWADGRASEAQAIGDVLLWSKNQGARPRTIWITPWASPTSGPQWENSIWQLGVAILRHAHGHRRVPTEVEGFSSLLASKLQLHCSGTWSDGR